MLAVVDGVVVVRSSLQLVKAFVGFPLVTVYDGQFINELLN